ncbi:Hypothetical predicted protein [Mytilus galloprovincialis]|uniref:B box-type domain-containing protein n=1 Tax=Mytilus galloprovincialis TaxID=29158 RepID=A0A8B6CGH6_MYTGA|nr:Hypothetical predicted protein [Mytilus galloprovincialis]
MSNNDTCALCELYGVVYLCEYCGLKLCGACLPDHQNKSCSDIWFASSSCNCALHDIIVSGYCSECSELTCVECEDHSKHVILPVKVVHNNIKRDLHLVKDDFDIICGKLNSYDKLCTSKMKELSLIKQQIEYEGNKWMYHILRKKQYLVSIVEGKIDQLQDNCQELELLLTTAKACFSNLENSDVWTFLKSWLKIKNTKEEFESMEPCSYLLQKLKFRPGVEDSFDVSSLFGNLTVDINQDNEKVEFKEDIESYEEEVEKLSIHLQESQGETGPQKATAYKKKGIELQDGLKERRRRYAKWTDYMNAREKDQQKVFLSQLKIKEEKDNIYKCEQLKDENSAIAQELDSLKKESHQKVTNMLRNHKDEVDSFQKQNQDLQHRLSRKQDELKSLKAVVNSVIELKKGNAKSSVYV